MDAPCNLQESIHVLVTKYLFVSSFWGAHQFGAFLCGFLWRLPQKTRRFVGEKKG